MKYNNIILYKYNKPEINSTAASIPFNGIIKPANPIAAITNDNDSYNYNDDKIDWRYPIEKFVVYLLYNYY